VSTTVASPAGIRAPGFTGYAWGVLGWNLLVVLWGVLVRASGSGAGCGSHWPLCNGEVIPSGAGVSTIIEFTHRLMSGVAFLATAGLFGWSWKLFPRGHRVRKLALASFAFLIAEAALGAGLVLFQYVAANASAGRAIYLSLHLVNTQILLAMLALTAWFSRDPGRSFVRVSPLFLTALFAAVVVSVTGAITALGDTLFPSSSLGEGVRQDFSTSAHLLIRLRVFHPVLATLAAAFFFWISVRALRLGSTSPAHRIGLAALILTIVQLSAGELNLALLAPIGMQILHLLLADLLWISLVLLTVESPMGDYRA
jgi:cytochrome c oxidase assembly protein subunit 15